MRRDVAASVGIVVIALAMAVSVLAMPGSAPQRAGRGAAPASASASPRIVVDTAKGAITIELFAADAPKSVEHILALVKRNFYRGLRVHRVERSLVQLGDPQTRDMSQQAYWGTGGSGSPIGVAEISRKHLHVRGAVALAHSGDPKYADSQFYIMKAASPSLDGKYAVIGQVVSGMEVVDRLEVADLVRNVTVK